MAFESRSTAGASSTIPHKLQAEDCVRIDRQPILQWDTDPEVRMVLKAVFPPEEPGHLFWEDLC